MEKTDLRICQALFFVIICLIFIACILFGPSISAQDICKNRYGTGTLIYAGLQQKNTIVYVSAQYVDKGFGFRVDRNLNKDIAIYGSVTGFGSYWTMGMYSEIPHQKYALGIVYCNNALPLIQPRLTAGISYHTVQDGEWQSRNPNHAHDWWYYLPDKQGNISCEFGVGMVVARWVAIAYRFDILRHEGNAELGINFKL
jgi:hypothetical protein